MKGLNRQSSLDAIQELMQRKSLRLEEVWERVEDGMRELIVLKFSGAVLSLVVDPDYDTVEVRCQDAEACDFSGLARADLLAPWSPLLGRPLSWGWVATNQQGYQDCVVLSFDNVAPSVLVVAAGSSLGIYSVSQPAGEAVAPNN